MNVSSERGEYDLSAHFRLHEFGEAKRDIEHDIFFEHSVRSAGTFVMTAMARVDYDSTDFQTECSGQRLRGVFRRFGHGVIRDRFRRGNDFR